MSIACTVELRTLLTEFAVGSSSKTSTIRKITPISAEDTSVHKPSDVQIQVPLNKEFVENGYCKSKFMEMFMYCRTVSKKVLKEMKSIVMTFFHN